MGKFNTSILIFKPKPISSLFKYVDAYEKITGKKF